MTEELKQMVNSFNSLAKELNTEGLAVQGKMIEVEKLHKADCPCKTSKKAEDCTDADYTSEMKEISDRIVIQKAKRVELIAKGDVIDALSEVEMMEAEIIGTKGAVTGRALLAGVQQKIGGGLLSSPTQNSQDLMKQVGTDFWGFLKENGHTSLDTMKSNGIRSQDHTKEGEMLNIAASFYANFGESQRELAVDAKILGAETNSTAELFKSLQVRDEKVKSMFTQQPNLSGGTGQLYAPTAVFAGNTGGLCEYLIDNELNILPYPEASFLDCIPVRKINKSYVLFLRQTLRINNASGVNESIFLPTAANPTGASVDFRVIKPESQFGFTQQRAYTITFADTLSVSEEFLEDCPAVADAVQTQLMQNVREEFYMQAINGLGTGGQYPEIIGLLSQIGLSTRIHRGAASFNGVAQANGGIADDMRETIVRAIFDAEVYGYNMDCVIMSHEDYVDMFFLKNELNIARYTDAQLDMIRGAKVRHDIRMPAGTAIVGAFRQVVQLLVRRQIRLDVGWIDKQFVQDMLTLRATMRGGLLVKVPHALVRITGI